MKPILVLLFLLQYSFGFAQATLYNQAGIRLSYNTATIKTVFCTKENRPVNFITVRWDLVNNSDKDVFVIVSCNMYAAATGNICLSDDNVIAFHYQGGSTQVEGTLKAGGHFYGEDGAWFLEKDHLPWWNLSVRPLWKAGPQVDLSRIPSNFPRAAPKPVYGVYQGGDVINNPKPNQQPRQVNTGNLPANKFLLPPAQTQQTANYQNQNKAVYGISQQGDVINNPKPVVDYAARQKEQDQATANAMKSWQNSSQEGQKQINIMNQLSRPNAFQAAPQADTRQIQLQQQQALQRQQQMAAQERAARLQQEAAEQRRHMMQMQSDLVNAQNASMSAYQQAIDNGRKESGAMLDATLAGAEQISDAKASLIYTGVGLGVSLFMHLSEKKEERLQKELAERKDGERKQLIIDTKFQYIKEALNINKYDASDLLLKDRYAAVLIVPADFDTAEQRIYFSYPLRVGKYDDGSYPLKPEIEKKFLAVTDKQLTHNKIIYTLYPISNMDMFVSDFVKKMGSGKVINLEASLIDFVKRPFEEDGPKETQVDFWGQPANKETRAKTDSTAKKKDFWDQ